MRPATIANEASPPNDMAHRPGSLAGARVSAVSHAKRTPGVILSMLVGLSAGVAAYWLHGLSYQVSVDIRCRPGAEADGAPAETVQAWWREFAAERLRPLPSGVDPRMWRSRVIGADILRLESELPKAALDRDAARVIVEEFLGWVEDRRIAMTLVPTEGERTLMEVMGEFQTRLESAEDDRLRVMESSHRVDPREERRELFDSWNEDLSTFHSERQVFKLKAAELDALRSAPLPTEAVVSPEKRSAVIAAHAALQQDMAELKVRLTEVKVQLSLVWQNASGPLEELVRAAGGFGELVARLQDHASSAELDRATPLMAEATQYQHLLHTFADSWNREFHELREVAVDPIRADVLEAYARVRTVLSDFLYQGAGRMAELREQLQAQSADGRDDARQHVLQSNLARAFQMLQSSHHRFEFAASALDTPSNVQLDSSLQGARGLRRRAQQEIRMIDERLAKQAIEEAGMQRQAAIDRLQAEVDELRRLLDDSIARLLERQQMLNVQAGLTEEYLRGLVQAESLGSRVEATKDHLGVVAKRLSQLAAGRHSGAMLPQPELASLHRPDRPANLGSCIQVASFSAIAVCLATHAIQWLALRRQYRPGVRSGLRD